MLSKRSPHTAALLIMLFIAIMAGTASAISEGGAIFLLIRPGARPSGMGSAFAAIADDATATYFNPAGLAYLMPEVIPYFRENDVKDWATLVGDLQDKDAFYLFQKKDLLDPASAVLDAKRSPALIVPDIKDWKIFGEILSDSNKNQPAYRLISAWLDSSARQVLLSDTAMTREQKWTVLCQINRQLAGNADLYSRLLADGLTIAPKAMAIVDDAKYSPDKKEFSPNDFIDAAGLAENIFNSDHPLSQYLRNRMSPRSKAMLKKGLPADSIGRVLSAELNKIIRSKIYRDSRFPGIVLSDELKAKTSASLKGDELSMLNMRLLELAYPRNISLWLDFARIGSAKAGYINRAVVEAYLPGIVAPFEERAAGDSLSDNIFTAMNDARWEALNGFNGQATMTPDEETNMVDFLNAVINGIKSPEAKGAEEVQALKAARIALEARFPYALASYQEKVRGSVLMHIRGLLSNDARTVCDKYATGKTIGLEDKETLLGGLNQLLVNRSLYQEAYFKNENLDPVTLALIREGVDYLSIDDLTGLNRKLIESAMSNAIKRKIEPIPHYATLMHSPWLSGIWNDVGDMYYEFIAYAQPVKDWGVFGGNVIYLSEGTNQHIAEDQTVLGTFSSYEFSPTLTYANKIYSNLAGGINLKLIYSHLAPFGAPGQQGKGIATTWAVDLGLLFHGPAKGLAFGLNVQNIGPNLTYIDAQESDPLSRNLRLGTAYNILDGKLTRLTTAWDVTKTIVKLSSDRPWRQELEEVVHHLGFEFGFNAAASLALRYGLVYDRIGHIGTNDEGNFDVVKASCFGAGVGYKKITFDFAMEPGGELQTRNKKFSLSAIF